MSNNLDDFQKMFKKYVNEEFVIGIHLYKGTEAKSRRLVIINNSTKAKDFYHELENFFNILKEQFKDDIQKERNL